MTAINSFTLTYSTFNILGFIFAGLKPFQYTPVFHKQLPLQLKPDFEFKEQFLITSECCNQFGVYTQLKHINCLLTEAS